MKAIWNGRTLAASDQTVVVENNHYFPPDSVDMSLLRDSSHTTVCHWKGTAHYFSLEAGGQRNDNAAWHYPAPKARAENIRGHVAFWKGVQIQA